MESGHDKGTTNMERAEPLGGAPQLRGKPRAGLFANPTEQKPLPAKGEAEEQKRRRNFQPQIGVRREGAWRYGTLASFVADAPTWR